MQPDPVLLYYALYIDESAYRYNAYSTVETSARWHPSEGGATDLCRTPLWSMA